MKYIPTIGLEVHAQLKTSTKLFCRCLNQFGLEPNSATCPICLGMPGALPALNKHAIELAIKAGLGLGCKIQPHSVFARKNYFYPDLPKGYQISQFDRPLCTDGRLQVPLGQVRITRAHVEEDAGKLLHGDSVVNKSSGSLVDLNRAGVPLIEIVSEPDIISAEHAVEYLKTLRNILVYLDVCDGNMEEGSMRCDANVSIRLESQKELGTKIEIKNVNSFRFVQKAIEFEIQRQTQILESGGTLSQETRLWNPDKMITVSMRSKEQANDYRYFPEPDLTPLLLEEAFIEKLKQSLPELPEAKKQRYILEYGLPEYDASVITSDRDIAAYFEQTLSLYATQDPNKIKKLSNMLMSEILRLVNDLKTTIGEIKITPAYFAKTLELIDAGVINGKIAKEVFDEIAQTGEKPESLVEKKGMSQISDQGEITKVIQQIIASNPKQVQEFKGGKEKLFGFFVGQVMKETQGKANSGLVNSLLREELKK